MWLGMLMLGVMFTHHSCVFNEFNITQALCTVLVQCGFKKQPLTVSSVTLSVNQQPFKVVTHRHV